MNIFEQENEQPPFALRPRDAAKALGISPSTLERMARAGEIPTKKIGRCTLYLVEDLKRWLNGETIDQSHPTKSD